MGWKSFSRKSGTKMLVTGVSILVLAAILGAQSMAPAGEPNGPKALEELTNALEETTASGIDGDKLAASDEDETSASDINREAAAGPQPDDTGPVAITTVPISNTSSPTMRVGIQAGHWRSAELPSELAGLRTSTGTAGGGVAEWELNLDIARRVVPLLQAEGIEVDILPASIPPGYQADAFIALHADGDASGRLSGFKLARARGSAIPETDDALLVAISEEYQAATKLRVDLNVTRNMTGYYAFSFRRFEHAIAPNTPAVILEMGFLTNASDRRTLLGSPDTVAEGIAQGIQRFLRVRDE